MTLSIDGETYKLMIINAAAAISLQQQPINELNVFPVPDGDTGTNMSLTIGTASSELKQHTYNSATKAADATARSLLQGARGNSGVILSLLFRGFAKSVKGLDSINSFAFATAMTDGVDAAYSSVMKPAEGTILTVSRIASAAALDLATSGEDDIEAVLERSIEVGYEALAETVNQNPVLKKAGVIDAGGKGYLIILDGMLKALRGETITDDSAPEIKVKADFSDFNTEDIVFGYCTEFIVSRDNSKDPLLLRAYLDSIGDSIVLVDDDEIIKVHVHTNEPGNVLTQALTYGSLITVKVENMRRQHTAKVIEESELESPMRNIASPEKKYGSVAVCAGDGLANIFQDLGVDNIISGGQTMNPSTEDILREIDRTPAEIVYVLPNNKNIIMAAQQCIPLSEKHVIVIPSKSVPQGISAMISLDTGAEEEENTAALNDAITRVHTVEVTYAARDSEFDGASIKAGEYLALLDNSLIGSDTDLTVLFNKILDAVSGFDPEFINVFYGDAVNPDDADALGSFVTSRFSDAEVAVISGGQPVYYYLISVE